MATQLIQKYPFLPPLLIGAVSLLGICVILVTAFLPSQDVESIPTRTPTPFKYQFLATETLMPTAEAVTAGLRVVPTASPKRTAPPTESTAFLLTAEPTEDSTAEFSTPIFTMTPNPIFDNAEPLPLGTYDDDDYRLTYIGVWNAEEDLDAFLETVFVSETVGDYLAFSFIGIRMGVGYQGRPDAGKITINIDGSEETITQQVGILWNSDDFESGTHNVIITHTGEGPINIDYIEIPE